MTPPPPTPSNVFSRLVGLALGGVFLYAAVAKAWAAPDFVRVVRFLAPQLPDWTLRLSSASLVMTEVVVGVALGAGCRRPRFLAAVAGLLLCFSGVLLYLALQPDAPGCGCLGVAGSSSAPAADARAGLLRNAGLLTLTALLVGPSARSAGTKPPASLARSAGFTLVEVLVALCVVAILVALALPALGRARSKAHFTKSLSVHRHILVGLASYTNDSRERFPYFATPGRPTGGVTIRGFALPYTSGCFADQSRHWLSLMVPDYMECDRRAIEPPDGPVYASTNGFPDHVILSRYQLTYNAFAAPAYWERSAAGNSADLRSTQVAEVAHPSRKGLVLDTGIGAMLHDSRAFAASTLSAGLADGSARTFESRNVDQSNLVVPHYVPGAIPIMCTRWGLAGADF